MSEVKELMERLIQERNQLLHPDLEPYLETDGVLGAQIRHPLVYQVPLISNGSANAYYAQKKKAVEDALIASAYGRFIFLHERPYRLEAFTKIADKLPDAKYWSLLSAIWTDTENGFQNIEQWRELFSSSRPSRNFLMNEDEQFIFDNLADKFTVYRGCQEGLNEDGISWTLKREKAEWFANRFQKAGVVLEKEITKQDAVALFIGRNESEVVVI
jgi:hypothetical protein